MTDLNLFDDIFASIKTSFEHKDINGFLNSVREWSQLLRKRLTTKKDTAIAFLELIDQLENDERTYSPGCVIK